MSVDVSSPNLWILIAVIFFAIFSHSLTGFGSALVAMAILPSLLGLKVAAPLVALVAATAEIILLIHYRSSINLQPVWRLVVGAFIGIPIGVAALRLVNERITLTILGLVIIAYALYALLRFHLPQLKDQAWAFIFGLAAGLLGGAYNTSGPAVVIYGDCRRWSQDEFKANLQGFFLLNDLFVILTHAASGNLTPPVWQDYLLSLPAIGLGLWSGLYAGRFLNPSAFRTIVLCSLVVLGFRMLF